MSFIEDKLVMEIKNQIKDFLMTTTQDIKRYYLIPEMMIVFLN